MDDASSNIEATVSEASRLTSLGRLSEARDILGGALQQTPNSADLLMRMSELAVKVGDFAAAATCCERAIEIEGGEPWRLYALSGFLLRAAKLDAAEDAICRALQFLPEQQQLLLRLSEIFRRKGQLPEAARWGEKAIISDAQNSWAYYNVSRIYLEQLRLDEALAAAEKALLLTPNQTHFLILIDEVKSALKVERPPPSERAREVFSLYYSNKAWGSQESVSGKGSEFNATAIIRPELEAWLSRQTDLRTFLDAPCGDFNWIRHLKWPNPVKYIGGDIVADLIASNVLRYASESVSFAVLDIIDDPLPDADVWLCRDALIHFPFDVGSAVVAKFRESPIRFFIATTFPSEINEVDCAIGGYHRVNLSLAPYSLGPPEALLRDPAEESAQSKRYLGVWKNPRL